MTDRFLILVTDLNPRIRSFLSRELTALGYQTVEAGREAALRPFLVGKMAADLLILDPEIARDDLTGLLGRILELKPELPIVIHSSRDDPPAQSLPLGWRPTVVKNGFSIQGLAEEVDRLLHRHYPKRWPDREPAPNGAGDDRPPSLRPNG